METKIGIGYDVHRLVSGRELIIGGVRIDYEFGLLGHSDADVLTHAVTDALLGAMGMRDIGVMFPDTDLKYKDISSLLLLKEVGGIINRQGYTVSNIDCVVVAQKPKLAPYIDSMQSSLADSLSIPAGKINIKATTEEGLGFTGDGSGIAAKAVCCIYRGLIDERCN